MELTQKKVIEKAKELIREGDGYKSINGGREDLLL